MKIRLIAVILLLAFSLMAFIPGRPIPGQPRPSKPAPSVVGIPPLPSVSLIPIPQSGDSDVRVK